MSGEDRSLANNCSKGCDMCYGTGTNNIIARWEDVKGRLPGGGDMSAGFCRMSRVSQEGEGGCSQQREQHWQTPGGREDTLPI